MINHDRLLATFLDLVRIDNPSGGEATIAAHIRGLLEAIGLAVEEDAVHNLLARVPGAVWPVWPVFEPIWNKASAASRRLQLLPRLTYGSSSTRTAGTLRGSGRP